MSTSATVQDDSSDSQHKTYDFDTAYYLERRFSDPYDSERGVQPFYLKSIHDFYSHYHTQWDTASSKMLEYGGGPVIYSLISPCRYVGEIMFVDNRQSSIDAIIGWKTNGPGAHNWRPYIEYVTKELEDFTSEEIVLQRENELQNKLKYFSTGDLREEHIVDMQHDQFDIVSSMFCLEVAAKTREEYQSFLKKLATLVKTGGFLVSLISLEESFWLTKKNIHSFHLFLTREDTEEDFRAAGLSIVHTALHKIPEEAQNILNDCKALYFIAAQKLY